MLADRLRTSFVMICVVAGLLFLDACYSPSHLAGLTSHSQSTAGLYLLPLLLFFALGTAWELAGLLRGAGFPVHRLVALMGAGIIAASPGVVPIWNSIALALPGMVGFYPPGCPIGQMGWIALATTACVSMLFLLEMKNFSADSDSREVLSRLSAGTMVLVYVGIPMALLVAMRSLGNGNWGLAALLTMIATTKSTDAGAYFSGKAFGKRKLIPRLSPGKTWEGAIGGVIVATIVAAICLAFLFPAIVGSGTNAVSAEPDASPTVFGGTAVGEIDSLDSKELASRDLASQNLKAQSAPTELPPLALALVLGPSLAILGTLGDLAQSLVKRACQAKDSGNLLPGLGGVWDVSDSLIFASFPAFLCFVAVA
ncbi:phosphatidate cytidylyltransferase [Neorhodopirellula lusitana]|uniref:Phosphatidate cytidylyltransferase n=2 Tax=Neorhodopirellula lusitana TaxID=445327 RepID=A0ABY1Q1R4_9BACT|nr:phosphatidate cytidylyltransferase [Neorhodopirellula lusitana]